MQLLALLPDRGVIEVAGEDRVAFLQGLVSNDVALAAPGTAVWAAFLTPQGKWLADFFILAEEDRLLLDCERGQIEMLVGKLSRYRLRARVTVNDRSPELGVAVGWGDEPPELAGAHIVADPRLPAAGWRVISPVPPAASADAADWDAHRLSLGLPDGSRDLDTEKTVLLEAGFDELNGISWTKGCYMGQELTARTRYRGLLKRRLVPVAVAGASPPPGTPVTMGGVEVGTMRSSQSNHGLALLRLEAITDTHLACADAQLMPRIPAWMRLPEPAASS